MTEAEVIEELTNYKRMQARKQVLDNYSVGAGITVSRLNQDDHLQELHHKLRGVPSYMYLSKHEQKLETIAHTYLDGKYPNGIKSQQRAIAKQGQDEEDSKLLRELHAKIEKVVAARGYSIRDDLDAVLDRLSEYQDLQAELEKIDNKIVALESYKPDLARLLKLRFIENQPAGDVAEALGIVRRTFDRWKKSAIEEYRKLS